MNYNRHNGNKCFYIGASMVKGVRCVRVGRCVSGCSDSDCVGLFDFVMAHYADDVALMRLNLWDDTDM